MPNIKSAKKRVVQNAKKEEQNKTYEVAVTKGMKKITKMSKAEAKKSHASIQSKIAKAAKKGVIHKNKAARMQRRVSKMVS